MLYIVKEVEVITPHTPTSDRHECNADGALVRTAHCSSLVVH